MQRHHNTPFEDMDNCSTHDDKEVTTDVVVIVNDFVVVPVASTHGKK